MNFSYSSFREKDAKLAAALDRKWFGKSAISEQELLTAASSLDRNVVLFSDENLIGFAIFEVLEATEIPSSYQGVFPLHSTVLFLQQFTTTTNYEVGNTWADKALLDVVEQTAMRLGSEEVWEALAVEHPYSKEQNPKFDAFGFYAVNGYEMSSRKVIWQPNESINIPCLLLSKKLQ